MRGKAIRLYSLAVEYNCYANGAIQLTILMSWTHLSHIRRDKFNTCEGKQPRRTITNYLFIVLYFPYFFFFFFFLFFIFLLFCIIRKNVNTIIKVKFIHSNSLILVQFSSHFTLIFNISVNKLYPNDSINFQVEYPH